MKSIFYLLTLWALTVGVPQEPGDKRMILHDFTMGTVHFKDRTEVQAQLNYDTFDEQMIFENNGKVMALANPETIDHVELNGKTFYWLEKDIFLEKIDSSSVVIYKRNRRQMQSRGKETSYGGTSQTQSVSTVTSMARNYDLQSTDLALKEKYEFVDDNVFYLYAEGKFRSISSVKPLSKFFDVDKNTLTKFIQENNIDLQNTNDVIKIIRYCQKQKL